MKKLFIAALFCGFVFTAWRCAVANSVTNFLLPDVKEDAALGLQVSNEISSKPSEYPILSESGNEELYGYVRGITQKILNSGNVQNRGAFQWQVKIINDPKTLNAFCTPGGYIYVYTGIIKYLDSEDQLAGVMAHEIAHADRRHSMTQMYQLGFLQTGVAIGTQVATAKSSQGTQQAAMTVAQLATAIVGLKFSRDHESDADAKSVDYLCNTEYNSAGAAGFFEKIGNAGGTPEFLSTHPSPANRVQSIKAAAAAKSCSGNQQFKDRYARIKSLIR
jgi:beta-barrel assembly-enhancing protease